VQEGRRHGGIKTPAHSDQDPSFGLFYQHAANLRALNEGNGLWDSIFGD